MTEKTFQHLRYEKMGFGGPFGNRHLRAKDRARLIAAMADANDYMAEGGSVPSHNWEAQDAMRVLNQCIVGLDNGFYDLVWLTPEQQEQVRKDGIAIHDEWRLLIIQCLWQFQGRMAGATKAYYFQLSSDLLSLKAMMAKTA